MLSALFITVLPLLYTRPYLLLAFHFGLSSSFAVFCIPLWYVHHMFAFLFVFHKTRLLHLLCFLPIGFLILFTSALLWHFLWLLHHYKGLFTMLNYHFNAFHFFCHFSNCILPIGLLILFTSAFLWLLCFVPIDSIILFNSAFYMAIAP